MSFHPEMSYGATFHKSARALEDEGPPFEYTSENRARFDEIILRYPPDRRRSVVLPALYLAQYQQGYITASAIRYVAGLLGITPADVEDVVSFYTMFYTRPVGRHVIQVLPRGAWMDEHDPQFMHYTLEGSLWMLYYEVLTHLYTIQRLKRVQSLPTRVVLPRIGYLTLPEYTGEAASPGPSFVPLR